MIMTWLWFLDRQFCHNNISQNNISMNLLQHIKNENAKITRIYKFFLALFFFNIRKLVIIAY